MADKQRQFMDLFRDYMKPSGRDQNLFKFIDSLRFEDLCDCASSYFEHDTEYAHQQAKSSAVFVRLTVNLVDKGDVYFALRLEIMMRSPGTPPWESHYTALSPKDKSTLQTWLLRKKRLLTAIQREFIDLFDRYMKKQITQNKLETFTSALKSFEFRRDCLFAYVEISQGYAARNGQESLLIFLGLSRATIWLGDAYFALTYKAKVAQKSSTWLERYQSMTAQWRNLIEQDIAEKKKGATGKDADIGHDRFAPVPAEKAHPEYREKTAPLGAVQKRFLQLQQQFVDSGDRKAMDALQEFLRVHSFEDLRACVDAYLSDSIDRRTGGNTRSLAMFFGVVSAALAKGDGYYAFKVRFLVHTPGTIWNERFSALDRVTYRDRLEAQLNDEIRRKARLIDYVKAAYFAKYESDPDLQALQTFEPAVTQSWDDWLSEVLSDCEIAVSVSNFDSFEKALTDLGEIFSLEKDPVTVWVLIKRCRERPGLDARFRHLLYLYGVGMLFINVQRTRAAVYKSGFNAEERAWLLAGSEPGNRYFADFVMQLEYTMLKRSGRPTLTALCVAQGILHIYADKFRLVLTPTIEGASLLGDIETLWETKWEEMAAIRFPIMSRRKGRQELRVGQTIGNFYILWWDFKRGVVYLLVNGLDKVVFETRQERLAEILDDDAIYGEIARRTQHLLELIPIFWQVILYIPDFISGGVTGLVKSIAYNYAFERSVDALGVDPTQAQLLLLGLSMLAHGLRPKEGGGPKIEEGMAAAERNTGQNARAAAAQDRMIETRGIEPVGGDAVNRLAESRTGTEMRGIDRGDVTEIRGADPDIEGLGRIHGTDDPGSGAIASHSSVDSRGETPGSHATDVPQNQHRGVEPHDRGTGAPHDDPVASPGGGADKGLQESPEVMRVGEGLSGRQRIPYKPPKAVKNRPPLPHRISERVKRGDWSQQGNLPINENGFRFKKPATNWREFEQGFNQEIVEPLAQSVSDKPVLKRGPEDFGYKTPSSAATNQLKMQKTWKGPDSLMSRVPDASMVVIEKLPGVGETMAEAHFFEATMETDFKATAGEAGRKQRQVAGTIGTLKGRKGYTGKTRVYYHIVTPRLPSPSTVEFLEKMMAQFPNLEINWFVVEK